MLARKYSEHRYLFCILFGQKILVEMAGETGFSDCEDVDGYCVFETGCTDIGGSELSAYSLVVLEQKYVVNTSPYSETCK